MWEELKIEKFACEKFIQELGATNGRLLCLNYETTRDALIDEILPEIKARETGLTDHGPKHIKNVLNNVYYLLEKEGLEKLNACELYCLLIGVLLHDVGNLHERKNHQRNITDIYRHVRPLVTNEEKRIVTRIVGAHAGETITGSPDTLRTLKDSMPFMEKGVRVGELAALLRFADELAEGPQRTSKYMIEKGYYPEKSQIFHKYANITKVYIDRGNSRIVLTYDLDIKSCKSISEYETELSELLEYSYKRIVKMDQERKFNKFYCSLLSPFKKIEVSYVFWIDDDEVDLGLEKLILDDLVVPGESSVSVQERNEKFVTENILKKINEVCFDN